MKALSNYFKDLTLQEVWDNNETALLGAGMPMDDIEELRQICSLYIPGPLAALDFLRRHNSEGNIFENANLTAYRLNRHLRYRNLAVATFASLCHVGKQYTISTDEFWHICFPSYSIVSAYLAAAWLKNSDVPERRAKAITAIVYAHDFPFTKWLHCYDEETRKMTNYRREYRQEMEDFMGKDDIAINEAMEMIEDLSLATIHFTKLRRRDYRHMRKGLKIISRFPTWSDTE